LHCHSHCLQSPKAILSRSTWTLISVSGFNRV
jgi:hypothetical protein